jgi:branched-chain amino acid transport system ATP-binding protein
MEVVFGIAEKITVLHQGRVIADGSPTAVRADAEVRRVYLGERR